MVRFRDDERGAMALIIMFTFLAMIMFGGIAIDVMRFETRRVAMQQTLDRAALAAASLTQTRTPQQVVDDYFAKAKLGEGLFMVDFEAPVVTALTDAGLRRVTASAKVTSTNFFMGIFSPLDTLEGPIDDRGRPGRGADRGHDGARHHRLDDAAAPATARPRSRRSATRRLSL